MPEKAEALSKAFGYMSIREVREIEKFVRSFKNAPIVVNIGAGPGTSSLAVVETRPDSIVYTIDCSQGGPLGGLENEIHAFKDTGLNLPIQILGDSKTVGAVWKDDIDFLIVDGDHSESGIRGDIAVWLPHLKEKGIVSFHDYNPKAFDVKRVIDEIFALDHPLGKTFVKISKVDLLISFRKKVIK